MNLGTSVQRILIRPHVIRSAILCSYACKMQLKIFTVHSHTLQYSPLLLFQNAVTTAC